MRLKFKKDLHLPIQSRLKFGKQIAVSLNVLDFLGGKIEIHTKSSVIAKMIEAWSEAGVAFCYREQGYLVSILLGTVNGLIVSEALKL